jgi:hypothetical protein
VLEPPANSVRTGLKRRRNLLIGSLRSQNLAAIESGLAGYSLGCSSPRPILYELDLNGDESRKGSLRVHSLAVFVHGLLDDSLGVRAPAILIQNRLNQRRIPKG